MSSLFTERSNGRTNNRTFSRDKSKVWRGTGLHAVPTPDSSVYEFRVWDESRPMYSGRKLILYSPDGTHQIECTVDTFSFSRNLNENERGKSVNCGVMVIKEQKERETKRTERQ